MLRATPFHRENYSQLIVSVIHQFYQRCFERYKGASLLPLLPFTLDSKFSRLTTSAALSSADLTARDAPDSNGSFGGTTPTATLGPLKLAATWADMPELHACLTELRGVSVRSLLSVLVSIDWPPD